MAKYFRNFPRNRAGSFLWTDQSPASVILDLEFFDSATGAYSITFDAGTYSATGNDIGLQKGSRLVFDSGNYSQTGNDIGLNRGYVFTFDSGSYSQSGSDLGLRKGYFLGFDSAVYSLTGNPVNMARGYVIAFDAGYYTIDGNPINFIYTPASTPPLLAADEVLDFSVIADFNLQKA